MESKRSENLTKNESDTISEFLPPPHPKIAFNHISQEISERAKAILDDLLTKKQITPDKVRTLQIGIWDSQPKPLEALDGFLK